MFGILGHGQIGSSLRRVYELAGIDKNEVVVRDPFQGLDSSLSRCEIINVCLPFHGYDQLAQVLRDLDIREGCLVFIQSTVEVGCTDRLQTDFPALVLAHSPVRGVHPNLTEGFLTFEKFVGVSDRFFTNRDVTSSLVRHVEALRIKPVVCRAREAELAKLVSTTLYGMNIAAVTDVSNLCESHGADFDTVFTKWQVGYNTGYRALGLSHVCRPVLTPIPKHQETGKQIIGGHCVVPNATILKTRVGETDLTEFVLRYSDQERLTHGTSRENVDK